MKRLAFLMLVFTLLGGCRVVKVEEPEFKKTSLAHTIGNFHIVAPGVMRGSLPSEEGFRKLREQYTTKMILNLHNDPEYNEFERKLVEGLGMHYINIPMSGGERQSIEIIEKCLDIINNASHKPIFVHCQAGKDRTGLVFAAYRIKYDNWSIQDALLEMRAYGYDRKCCLNLEKSLIEWYEWRKKRE